VLPAVLFTVAMVVFPTAFGLYIAFTDWNLQAVSGRSFNGLDNLRQLFRTTVLERDAQHALLLDQRARASTRSRSGWRCS
jgi:ABC-type sugar transport system permease subunit